MTDKMIPVEVHYMDKTERAKARQVLEDVGGELITNYDGFISGLVKRGAFKSVANCGLFVTLGEDVDVTPSPALASVADQVGEYFPQSVLKGQMVELVDSFRSLSAHVKLVPANHDEEVPLCDEDSGDICTKSIHTLEKLEYLNEPRAEPDPQLDGFNYERLGSSTHVLLENDELLPYDAYLVRLAGALTAQRRGTLANLNVELKNRRPLDTYTALLNGDQLSNLKALDFVQAVKRYSLADTLTTSFQERLAAAAQTVDGKVTFQDQEPLTFEVTLHSESHLYKVTSLIQASTGEKILEASGCHFWFTVKLGSPVLSALANLPEIAQISPYEAPTIFCDLVRELVGVEKVSPQPQPLDFLDGDGEVVGVIDTGVDRNHFDLSSQISEVHRVEMRGFTTDDLHGHGTHVAGTIAGTGDDSDGKFRGMAPEAKLISVGASKNGSGRIGFLPSGFKVWLKKLRGMDARIINLSWGSKPGYGAFAQDVDEFVYQHPDTLVVIAAGNSGPEPGTVGSPADAKNVIAVGSSTSGRSDPAHPTVPRLQADLIADSSSRGPALYKAIKPDLLAPGTFVVAPRASRSAIDFYPGFETYTCISGTSMASPAVAGAAALLRQHIRVTGVSDPSAALLKALLIASCEQVSESPTNMVGFPDFDQGHGRIDLRNIIPHNGTLPNYRAVWVDVANDSEEALTSHQPVDSENKTTHLYKITTPTIVTPQSRLKIVLAFIDSPGAHPQNNLNLQVTESGGSSRWAGNHDHHLTDTTDNPGSMSPDLINTVEQVCVRAPRPDTVYTIKVTAQDTPYPKQGYALAVCGQMEEQSLIRL